MKIASFKSEKFALFLKVCSKLILEILQSHSWVYIFQKAQAGEGMEIQGSKVQEVWKKSTLFIFFLRLPLVIIELYETLENIRKH